MSTTTPMRRLLGSSSQATTPCSGGRQSRRLRGLRAGLAAALVAAGAVAIAPGATAADNQSSSNDRPAAEQSETGRRPHHPRLTDEQRSCIEDQGVDLPERPPRDNANRDNSDEQNNDSSEQSGNDESEGNQERARGERHEPTAEQRAAFEAATEACGIDLPQRPAGDQASRGDRQDNQQQDRQDNRQNEDSDQGANA
jgi:hypothetical protein